MKRCCTCKIERPIADFQRLASQPDGLQKRCRGCQAAASAAWWERRGQVPEIKGRQAMRRRAFYLTHHEQERASSKLVSAARYAANRIAILDVMKEQYAANPEPKRAAAVAWRAANPEKVNELSARRRARKRAAFVAPVNPASIYARDEGHCQLCGGEVAQAEMSLDHIVPLARGGTHEPANVQLAHLRCNIRKGTRLAALIEEVG